MSSIMVSCACCNGCAPPKGSNGEQGPDGDKAAKPFSPSPLPSPIQGEGGHETTSKPYGADGSIAEEYGVCQYILQRHGLHRRVAEHAEGDWGKGKRQTTNNNDQGETPVRLRCALLPTTMLGAGRASLDSLRSLGVTARGGIPLAAQSVQPLRNSGRMYRFASGQFVNCMRSESQASLRPGIRSPMTPRRASSVSGPP